MLQEDRYTDGGDVEDQVTAFLSEPPEEVHKDPPRLDYKGFQGLILAFLQLADVSPNQASILTTCALNDRQCHTTKSVRCHFPKLPMLESCESRRTA